MEGKEQNFITIIIIAVFLLAPMILKLLGKKFGVKQPHTEDEKPEESLHPFPLEIPGQPQFTHEPEDRMSRPATREFSNQPIKPKWF
jgi:hypothetical protein